MLNTAPVRVRVGAEDATAASFIRCVHSELLRRQPHEAYPLARIQQLCADSLAAAASGARPPLFHAIVDYQPASGWGFDLDGGAVVAGAPTIIDRIGTPLSIRFMLQRPPSDGAAELRVTATSECDALDAPFLRRTLAAVSAVLDVIAADGADAPLAALLAAAGAAPTPRPRPPLAPLEVAAAAAPSLPPPELPLLADGAARGGPSTATHGSLSPSQMDALRLGCKRHGVSPAAAACAAFTLAVDRHSSRRAFGIGARCAAAAPSFILEVEAGDRRERSFAEHAARVDGAVRAAAGAAGGAADEALVRFSVGAPPPTEVPTTVFAFHAAGSSAALFAGWAEQLRELSGGSIELVAIDLPGHGSRRAQEAAAAALPELLASVLADVAPRVAGGAPYALFGYSMGALVAYEVAAALTARGTPPRHLFVASQASPRAITAAVDPTADDATLAAALADLGWLPAELAAGGPDVWAVVLPLYRADLELEAAYDWEGMRRASVQTLACAVSVFAGDDDGELHREGEIEGWAEVTTGAHELRRMAGGHLFTQDDDESLRFTLAAVTDALGGGDGAPPAADDAAVHCRWEEATADGAARWSVHVRDGMLRPEVATGLVKAYESLLLSLCADPSSWRALIAELLPEAAAAVPVAPPRPLDRRLLHEPFLAQAAATAGAVAVVAPGDRTLSYADLDAASAAVCARLTECVAASASAPAVVAVVAGKGWSRSRRCSACCAPAARTSPSTRSSCRRLESSRC